KYPSKTNKTVGNTEETNGISLFPNQKLTRKAMLNPTINPTVPNNKSIIGIPNNRSSIHLIKFTIGVVKNKLQITKNKSVPMIAATYGLLINGFAKKENESNNCGKKIAPNVPPINKNDSRTTFLNMYDFTSLFLEIESLLFLYLKITMCNLISSNVNHLTYFIIVLH